MRSFDEIFAIAIERHGKDAIEARLAISAPQIDSKDDAKWLEEMARCIFQAGFSWKVIENKWPGFQTAFDGFNPLRVANYFDEDLDRLLSDRDIVRNHAKIKAVIDNAAFLNDLTKDHGSAAQFLSDWPSDDLASLLLMLTKRGRDLAATPDNGCFEIWASKAMSCQTMWSNVSALKVWSTKCQPLQKA